ncbi:PROTEIN KINASE SUPERFAMILY PROTEIN [Salix purpurea]|uniref:PROTEIN KINASE SUPERFAMILY PROTEIN n=1 Tax=Salix purpurea TaxID=77065 RepID=A0A9Q0Z9Z7_SALPP|nr:PROTEIN KINASE SUPERFAMILY PROTEIN [Salix purpurea]
MLSFENQEDPLEGVCATFENHEATLCVDLMFDDSTLQFQMLKVIELGLVGHQIVLFSIAIDEYVLTAFCAWTYCLVVLSNMFTLVNCAVTGKVIIYPGQFLYCYAPSLREIFAHNLLTLWFFSSNISSREGPLFHSTHAYEDLPPSMIKKLAEELKNLESLPEGIALGVNDCDFSVSEADIEVPAVTAFKNNVSRMKQLLSHDFRRPPPKGGTSDQESIGSERKRSKQSGQKMSAFDVPFELIELQKFDYALEGVSFQQLVRMPNAVYASTSDAAEATAHLAIEDFLHASAEKAIGNGKLNGLCATGLLLDNPRHPHGKWDHILELALLRPHIRSVAAGSDRQLSLSVLGEALFYALRILLSRSLSTLNFCQSPNCAYVLLVDSQYGGVVKVEGDVDKLELDVCNVYDCSVDWIKKHCKVSVSPIDRIWNKLGNANWGDIGALQVLFATFHCIVQYAGMPKHSIEDLAADHGPRLQTRRVARQLGDSRVNGHGLFQFQQRSVSPEIVEVPDESIQIKYEEFIMKLEVGSILWLEDSDQQKGYQINDVVHNNELCYYIASPVKDPGKSLFLYVGSHPYQLEPAWEDMNLWFQVQRQTKILTVMRQKGLSSKYLPQLSASGRIVHPGQCQKPSSGGNCDHPWCGTPILVTHPVGETVADMVNAGGFGLDEAIRCCHDCLSALSSTSSADIRHGDIRPENILCVRSGVRHPYFVLVGWGHAILEDRDRPAMSLHFSSTYALQERKLCSASDAESLVYVLYFACGGALPDLDSVEGALQWRETSWSRRLIQLKLGEVSTVLKAFADYVDSLCGTPYPIDYDIWLRRLRRNIHDDGLGKEADTSG